MATIVPFRGVRYNSAAVKDLAAVITPPYDVIRGRDQDSYYERSNYNLIRLEYGRALPGDTGSNNRYSRAAATFKEWLSSRILILDEDRSFYLYRQSFAFRGTEYQRSAILAALQLEPYENKIILPHEETLASPKTDRLELLRHCHANFSPIFTLFSDPDNQVEQLCASLYSEQPLSEFIDDTGQAHRLWAISNQLLQEQLQALLASMPLLIADGHHRYETGLAFSREYASSLPGARFILAALVCLHSPGLLILPTHRLLHGLNPGQEQKILEIASRNFLIEDRGHPAALNGPEFRRNLQRGSLDAPTFGLILPSQVYQLTLSPAERLKERLDVNILQEKILGPFLEQLGISSSEQLIDYCREETEAVELILSGEVQAAFILNPTPVEEVVEKAGRGERMPQKSTYFYPKLPSGLVIYTHDC